MEKNVKITRLAKPVQKGIGRLLFSRFFLIVLLIILQVALAVGVYLWVLYEVPELLYVQWIFTFVMIGFLFNSDMDSSPKLTWMLLIAVIPVVGAALLLFTQLNIGHRVETEDVKRQIKETRNSIRQSESVFERARLDGSGIDDLSTYLNKTGCFPVYDKTQVTYYSLGEHMFDAMIEELEKAQKFIFLEYFIIEEGYMWGAILDILERKAKEGVEVRAMYDGMCETSTLPYNYWELMEEHGIHAKSFSRLRPIVSSHYNYRDHRKVLVIDGKVAFTGGVNLADEYINRIVKYGHWKDTAVMLKGNAVKSFTLMFLQMWNIKKENAAEDYEKWLSMPAEPVEEAAGYVMPYCDCPLDNYKAGEAVYMDILNRANSYVYIMTPYLILDGELETSILFAAQRGVDVRLMLPGIPDKFVPYALAKSHYRRLYDGGVKIYEYTPGFVHSKIFVSDDIKAVVGTINLDYRSLYHHFECAAYMYGTDCIKDIKKDFDDTLLECREVTNETIENEKLSYRAAGFLAKSIAPLL